VDDEFLHKFMGANLARLMNVESVAI